MTFRHSLRHRWLVPSLLCAIIGGMTVFYYSLHRDFRKEICTVAGAILAVLVIVGWILWAEYVRVDDVGIQWKRASISGALKWDQVSRIEAQETGSAPQIGLIDRQTGQFHPLPLVPKELYKILKQRCGGLPRSIESQVFGNCD